MPSRSTSMEMAPTRVRWCAAPTRSASGNMPRVGCTIVCRLRGFWMQSLPGRRRDSSRIRRGPDPSRRLETPPESLRLMPRPKRPGTGEAIREGRTEKTPRPESGGTPAIHPASKGNHGAAKQRIWKHAARWMYDRRKQCRLRGLWKRHIGGSSTRSLFRGVGGTGKVCSSTGFEESRNYIRRKAIGGWSMRRDDSAFSVRSRTTARS